MIATTIEQRVAQFKQNIFMKLHHRTLLEYTGQPVVSDDELFYLLLPALNGERWSDKQDLAATGVAINLAALNTHELIEEFEIIKGYREERDPTKFSQELNHYSLGVNGKLTRKYLITIVDGLEKNVN